MRVHGHSAAGPSAGCEAAGTVTSPRTLRRPPRTPAAPGSGVPGRGPQTPRTRKRAGEGAQPPPPGSAASERWERAGAAPQRLCRPGPVLLAGARKMRGRSSQRWGLERGGGLVPALEETRSLGTAKSNTLRPVGTHWEDSVLLDHLCLPLPAP